MVLHWALTKQALEHGSWASQAPRLNLKALSNLLDLVFSPEWTLVSLMHEQLPSYLWPCYQRLLQVTVKYFIKPGWILAEFQWEGKIHSPATPKAEKWCVVKMTCSSTAWSLGDGECVFPITSVQGSKGLAGQREEQMRVLLGMQQCSVIWRTQPLRFLTGRLSLPITAKMFLSSGQLSKMRLCLAKDEQQAWSVGRCIDQPIVTKRSWTANMFCVPYPLLLLFQKHPYYSVTGENTWGLTHEA